MFAWNVCTVGMFIRCNTDVYVLYCTVCMHINIRMYVWQADRSRSRMTWSVVCPVIIEYIFTILLRMRII